MGFGGFLFGGFCGCLNISGRFVLGFVGLGVGLFGCGLV